MMTNKKDINKGCFGKSKNFTTKDPLDKQNLIPTLVNLIKKELPYKEFIRKNKKDSEKNRNIN